MCMILSISYFQSALDCVQPSAKREGFATVPNTTWEDVGALEGIREELSMAILAPVRYPQQFASLGLSSPPGVLLAGPPGCGKTLLAKVHAHARTHTHQELFNTVHVCLDKCEVCSPSGRGTRMCGGQVSACSKCPLSRACLGIMCCAQQVGSIMTSLLCSTTLCPVTI